MAVMRSQLHFFVNLPEPLLYLSPKWLRIIIYEGLVTQSISFKLFKRCIACYIWYNPPDT